MSETKPPGAVPIRLMRPDDLGAAHELRALAGWNQSERDWRGFLAYEPEGCFVAELGGRVVGTATTIRYGRHFGWIGMVLVHPEWRRHGIGSALLRHAIASLHAAGVDTVKLDATPQGRTVYLPLGFTDEYDLARYEGVAPAAPPAAGAGIGIGPWLETDDAAVVALDAEAFGAERGRVLRTLARRHPELAWVARKDGQVAGCLCGRIGATTVQVGPWVARDAEVAAALLRAFFAAVAGRRVFFDVLDSCAGAKALLEAERFTVQRRLTRMFLGPNRHPGRPDLVFGISSPEKG